MDKDKEVEIKPKKAGSPIINIMCSECRCMYSERNGHSCNEGYY